MDKLVALALDLDQEKRHNPAPSPIMLRCGMGWLTLRITLCVEPSGMG